MKTLLVVAALVLSSTLAQANERINQSPKVAQHRQNIAQQRRGIAQQRHHHRHHRRMPLRSELRSPELCQAIFATAQQARAVCRSAGYNWERARMGGATYTCTCGFDPSAPGFAFDAD